MMETLSTFPTFQKTLEECGNDWEKARAEYYLKVTAWHTRMIEGVTSLIFNSKKELQGMTPKMVLEMLLGTNQPKQQIPQVTNPTNL